MSLSENKRTEKNSDGQKNFTAKERPLFDLPAINRKRVEVSFTAQEVSSDGGLLLLKETERHVGIIKAISECITDTRHQGYIHHSLEEIAAQRVYQIVAGYEDANDCTKLRGDSILKMSVGRSPVSGADLSSQPTMTRFENTPSNKELYRMAYVFAQQFVRSYASEPEAIIIDCDDTNSDTHGAQQLSLYNDYYGEYCFMPLHIYEGLSGKLISTILKPGRRSKGVNVYGILRRLITFLRQSWKNTHLIVRGDSHFCSKDLMDWSVTQRNVHFITGLTGNQLLNAHVKGLVESCVSEYDRSKKPVKRYHSFPYKAQSWEKEQRVIVKIEVTHMGTNIRYIVTDLWEYRTRALYERGYCARGNMELMIKNHKTYLSSDRMSCHCFSANQFRLFLHSAAYVLMHALQTSLLKKNELASVTLKTLRERFIKIAAHVRELKTKISVEFASTCPEAALLEKYLMSIARLRC